MGLTPSGTKAMRFSGKDFGCLSIVLQGYSGETGDKTVVFLR
jgi:hypothetical protein